MAGISRSPLWAPSCTPTHSHDPAHVRTHSHTRSSGWPSCLSSCLCACPALPSLPCPALPHPAFTAVTVTVGALTPVSLPFTVCGGVVEAWDPAMRAPEPGWNNEVAVIGITNPAPGYALTQLWMDVCNPLGQCYSRVALPVSPTFAGGTAPVPAPNPQAPYLPRVVLARISSKQQSATNVVYDFLITTDAPIGVSGTSLVVVFPITFPSFSLVVNGVSLTFSVAEVTPGAAPTIAGTGTLVDATDRTCYINLGSAQTVRGHLFFLFGGGDGGKRVSVCGMKWSCHHVGSWNHLLPYALTHKQKQ